MENTGYLPITSIPKPRIHHIGPKVNLMYIISCLFVAFQIYCSLTRSETRRRGVEQVQEQPVAAAAAPQIQQAQEEGKREEREEDDDTAAADDEQDHYDHENKDQTARLVEDSND